MRNNFNRQKLFDYFIYNYECWICGQNGQDAFHHIIGRDSNSILNAAPVHNDKCHLQKSGWLHKPEVEKQLLQKTFIYLKKQDYQLIQKDLEFIAKYAHYYKGIKLGITTIAKE